MIYAQFYRLLDGTEVGNKFELVDGMEGRHRLSFQYTFSAARKEAARICARRGYDAWALFRSSKVGGESRLSPIMPA